MRGGAAGAVRGVRVGAQCAKEADGDGAPVDRGDVKGSLSKGAAVAGVDGRTHFRDIQLVLPTAAATCACGAAHIEARLS